MRNFAVLFIQTEMSAPPLLIRNQKTVKKQQEDCNYIPEPFPHKRWEYHLSHRPRFWVSLPCSIHSYSWPNASRSLRNPVKGQLQKKKLFSIHYYQKIELEIRVSLKTNVRILKSTTAPKLSELATNTYSLPWIRDKNKIHQRIKLVSIRVYQSTFR